jgi:hypothetical protein
MTPASRSRQINSPVQQPLVISVWPEQGVLCRAESYAYKLVLCALVRADNSCTHKVKYEPFDIPVAEFEATLINALQQIGVNAVHKS